MNELRNKKLIRIIGHLDMDAFFAAIEERDSPQFHGLPIVVGADPKNGSGRGVVSTANYKAREYGIHSAMPITEAWRRSESARKRGESTAVFLPVNGRRYGEVSDRVMNIVERVIEEARPPKFPLGNLERASIDEAYFDLSFASSFRKAAFIARKIKRAILKEELLTASIGIGPNKLIAKIASDYQKPDGLTVITEKEAERFLEALPIRKLSGIGPKTEAFFIKRGVKVVRDLKKFSHDQMREMLGKWGIALYEKVRAKDDSPVGELEEIKSIGEQETFERDTLEPQFVNEKVQVLCNQVFERFHGSGFQSFKTVVLSVRFADFETISRAHTLKEPADSLQTLKLETLKLLMPFFDRRENPGHKKFRLIGVRIERLA